MLPRMPDADELEPYAAAAPPGQLRRQIWVRVWGLGFDGSTWRFTVLRPKKSLLGYLMGLYVASHYACTGLLGTLGLH